MEPFSKLEIANSRKTRSAPNHYLASHVVLQQIFAIFSMCLTAFTKIRTVEDNLYFTAILPPFDLEEKSQ